MWRFAAVTVLAMTGFVGFGLSGPVQKAAFLDAFAVALLLPLVMKPTRTWQQAFWRCLDLVYTASAVGASLVAWSWHRPRLDAFAASILPGLLFGTMAALGIGRSGRGEE